MARGVTAIAAMLWLLALALGWPAPASATEHDPSEAPSLLSADEIIYDETLGIVTATGNVEISQGPRVLLADSVNYNMRTKVVIASGNISLLEPSGDVVFADYVELTDDLREGFVRDIRILMSDRSRLAAAGGQRQAGNRTEFRNAVFSPCELCRKDPTRAPLWQLKARKVIHDQEAHTIRYRDAWMEFFGVPVLYTPYLEHPDPTVKRKSGFLAPTLGNTTNLGNTIEVPYFWDIAPNRDVTFAPIFTSQQGLILAGEYRHLFPSGRVELTGSATIADRDDGDSIESNKFRGHIDATARFDIDETWRTGANVKRAADDTYMRLYGISSERTLTSSAFIEGFDGRNYAAANAFLYQGMRIDDINDELPIILPLLDYNVISEPDKFGNLYFFDANLLALTRLAGRDTRRLSLKGGWELPYTAPAGDVYTLSASLQADGYWVSEFDPNSSEVDPADGSDDLVGRLFPQLALQWRYPWARHGATTSQVIEPVAQIVLAPGDANQDDIPNEDSVDFEFDDTNLLSLNRFPGLDRVDPSSRLDYGLKWSVLGREGGYTSAFIGQSFRLDTGNVFVESSGLEDSVSDIVGRLQVQPRTDVDLSYRFRFDKTDFEARRNEFGLVIGPPALEAEVNYVFVAKEASPTEFDDREELYFRVASKLNQNWSTFASHRRDLIFNDSLSTMFGLTYQDECFLVETGGRRTFFLDRDVEPEDSIFVRVVLKHLGEFAAN